MARAELILHIRVIEWRVRLLVLVLRFLPGRFIGRVLDVLLPWVIDFKGVTCGCEGKVEARSIALGQGRALR